MIPLHGIARSQLRSPLTRSVFRIVAPGDDRWVAGSTALIDCANDAVPGLRLSRSETVPDGAVGIPESLNYLAPGDVVSVSPVGDRIRVLWRSSSPFNSVLLTERCDNFCVMCSQPPKARADDWLLDEAFELIRLLEPETPGFGFTGGEPTLYGDSLIRLLAQCRERLPNSEVHLLSNGRRFADRAFAEAYASVGHPGLMVGIPLYGPEPILHDQVVVAPGAFTETVTGVLNLVSLGQRVEIRIVLHQMTVPHLPEIAHFIARNLPFVDQVALMGLEQTGFGRKNLAMLWADPADYTEELLDSVAILDSCGIRTMIYNHQLCTIPENLWRFSVRSISDWKNEYLAQCAGCSVRDRCGGFFSSSVERVSRNIQAQL